MMGGKVVPHRGVFIELNANVKNLECGYESDTLYGVNPDINISQIEL